MDKHISNPFQFGTIVRGENFCNRQEELSSLKSYIRDGYSVWLYSPRRYGKSSLIHKAFSEIDGIETLYLDLYNVRSLDDFGKKYAALIAKNLFSWKQEIKKLTDKLSEYFRNLSPVVSFDHTGSPSFTLNVREITQQVAVETILDIPHQLSNETGKQICIAFDEFQEINRIEPFLINWMRSCFQQHDKVSYVFLGSQQSLMEKIFSSSLSPFYEFAVKLNIMPIQREELAAFIEEKFRQKGLVITSQNVEAILEKSGGHPHFTQYFASVVFDLIRSGEDQNEDNFTGLWTEKIIQSQSVIFQGIFDQLTNVQRAVLAAIALLKEDEELFSTASREKYRLPASSSLSTALASLQKKGLILKEHKQYRILNPVLKAWLITLD
jgi:hypothetical protein